jgi:hypothetical protein
MYSATKLEFRCNQKSALIALFDCRKVLLGQRYKTLQANAKWADERGTTGPTQSEP